MRLRFAPSPTGFLHIGNARTALINYLIAFKEKAELILRIEDTDFERSSIDSEISIFDDLKWLGIQWTEGPDKKGEFGPYRQSERFDLYRNFTEKLLENNNAYYCFCTQDEIKTEREITKTYEYSGKCRKLTEEKKIKLLSDGRKPSVRFHVQKDVTITFNDLIKGETTFNSSNIGGDFIIVRSDGVPVYNYIVIIDDALMQITHVVRGEDHLSNTPKQILIAQALGLPLPAYAHMALVLGPDKTKLSKRHGITSVEKYRNEGYLPEALVNYIAMLGWASESGEEILDLETIAGQFDISKLGKSAAVFDFQKLRWMNNAYIKNLPISILADLMKPYISGCGYDIGSIDSDILFQMIESVKNNCDVLSDIKTWIGIFLEDINTPDQESDTILSEPSSQGLINSSYNLFSNVLTETDYIDKLVPELKNITGLKGKDLFHPIRAMITGRLKGPDLSAALRLIGFERIKKRVIYCREKYC